MCVVITNSYNAYLYENNYKKVWNVRKYTYLYMSKQKHKNTHNTKEISMKTKSYKRTRAAMLHAVRISRKYAMTIRITRNLVTKYCVRKAL